MQTKVCHLGHMALPTLCRLVVGAWRYQRQKKHFVRILWKPPYCGQLMLSSAWIGRRGKWGCHKG